MIQQESANRTGGSRFYCRLSSAGHPVFTDTTVYFACTNNPWLAVNGNPVQFASLALPGGGFQLLDWQAADVQSQSAEPIYKSDQLSYHEDCLRQSSRIFIVGCYDNDVWTVWLFLSRCFERFQVISLWSNMTGDDGSEQCEGCCVVAGHGQDLADLPFVSLEDDDAITRCAAGQL